MNTSQPSPKSKKRWGRPLRLALAVAPLAWIYSNTDAAALAEALASANVIALLAAAALYILIMTLQGVKWWILIRRFVPELKPAKAVSVHLESTFYAIALPSGAAQDVVRSVILSKSHNPSVVWAASWLGRLIGLFTMLVYSVLGALYLKSGIMPGGFRMSLAAAAAVIAVLAAASFSKRFTRPLRAAAAWVIPKKYLTKIEKLRDGIYAFKHERKTLAQTFLISLAIQFMIFFTVSLTVYAVAGNFYFIECLAFVPLVEITAVSIPLTPGGLGLREGLMALLFTSLGFSSGQIASYVTISLLMSLTKAVGAAPLLWRMGQKITLKRN